MPTSTATADAPAGLHDPAGTAPDGWVVAVVGGPDPRAALARAGHRPTFTADGIALAGTVATVGPITVAGRITVDPTPTTTNPPGPTGTTQPTPLSGAAAARTMASTWLAAEAAGTGTSTVTGRGPAAAMDHLGMFGALVHDARTGRVTLLRDPLGERTLYHTRSRGDGPVWIADRIGPLRRARAATGELDLEALRNYLVFAYVPGTATLLADVREVAPGTTVDPTTGTTTTHWSLVDTIDHHRSLDEHATLLRHLLTDAVERRRPPGPVGVYLSGGVDSSTITALLCRQRRHEVHTFAIHFGPDVPNELAFVDAVVDRCRPGTHHQIELTPAELAATLPDTMAALDDPIGDPLTVPNLALGRRAAREVPVVFNGEGGDPVFGGPKNQPMLLAALYGSGHAGADIDVAYLRSYHKCFDDLDALLRPDIRGALRTAADPTAVVAPHLSAGSMSSFVNRLYAANTRLKGSDHILTKVANLTGAAGVLGRSPLFDRRIVEQAFSMPPTHKLHGSVDKAVLKAAVADLLPASVVWRPKAGMRVPVQTWFRGPLRRRASRELLSPRARIAPYLDRSLLRSWSRYDGDPAGRYGRKLWLVLSLEWWLAANDAG